MSYLQIKRIVDFICSFLALIVLSPVFLILVIAIQASPTKVVKLILAMEFPQMKQQKFVLVMEFAVLQMHAFASTGTQVKIASIQFAFVLLPTFQKFVLETANAQVQTFANVSLEDMDKHVNCSIFLS